MIVAPRDADRFAAQPPKDLRAALVFGPDAGLVQERAEKLMLAVVADLADPFNVADLGESVLAADPARLSDEAQAISMMGGRRVVRVRGAGNGLAALFEDFLEAMPGDALVVEGVDDQRVAEDRVAARTGRQAYRVLAHRAARLRAVPGGVERLG